MRDKRRIRERWVRFFLSLLNSKSDMLDADIPKRLPQHPVASALGIEATEEEIATAMKAMANAKAVGPDGLPAELLKVGRGAGPDFFLSFSCSADYERDWPPCKAVFSSWQPMR